MWLRRRRLEEEELQLNEPVRQEREENTKPWIFAPGSSRFTAFRKYGKREENPASLKRGANSAALAAWVAGKRKKLFPPGEKYDAKERAAAKYLEDVSGYLGDIRDAWSACGKLHGDQGYLEEIMRLEENLDQIEESAQTGGDAARTETLLSQNVERYNFLHRQIEQLTGNGQLRAAAGVLERAVRRMDALEVQEVPGMYWILQKLKKWLQEMIRELRAMDRKVFGKRMQRIHEKFSALQGAPSGEREDQKNPDPAGENKAMENERENG